MILAAIAVKLLTADLYELPACVSPAFIASVLAVVATTSIRDNRRRDNRRPGTGDSGPSSQVRTRLDEKPQTGAISGRARL